MEIKELNAKAQVHARENVAINVANSCQLLPGPRSTSLHHPQPIPLLRRKARENRVKLIGAEMV